MSDQIQITSLTAEDAEAAVVIMTCPRCRTIEIYDRESDEITPPGKPFAVTFLCDRCFNAKEAMA